MREYTNHGKVDVQPAENLADMVWSNAERFGSDTSLLRRRGDGWEPVTAGAFAAHVGAAAKGLSLRGSNRAIGSGCWRPPATSGPSATTRSGRPAR